MAVWACATAAKVHAAKLKQRNEAKRAERSRAGIDFRPLFFTVVTPLGLVTECGTNIGGTSFSCQTRGRSHGIAQSSRAVVSLAQNETAPSPQTRGMGRAPGAARMERQG